jgi:hypothetical protein
MDLGGKAARVTLDRYQFCLCYDLDVRRPTGLDQFRGKDSDGAIIGGKRLVELGHDSPDGGRFLNEIHTVA